MKQVFMVYVDANNTMCPWVIRFRDKKSISGFNEYRAPRVIFHATGKTKVYQDHNVNQGYHAFEIEGYLHWEGTTAIITGSRPKGTEDQEDGRKNNNAIA